MRKILIITALVFVLLTVNVSAQSDQPASEKYVSKAITDVLNRVVGLFKTNQQKTAADIKALRDDFEKFKGKTEEQLKYTRNSLRESIRAKKRIDFGDEPSLEFDGYYVIDKNGYGKKTGSKWIVMITLRKYEDGKVLPKKDPNFQKLIKAAKDVDDDELIARVKAKEDMANIKLGIIKFRYSTRDRSNYEAFVKGLNAKFFEIDQEYVSWLNSNGRWILVANDVKALSGETPFDVVLNPSAKSADLSKDFQKILAEKKESDK